MPIREEEDDEFDDEEDAGEEAYTDEDRDAAVETVPCPYCQREINEDAERCPHCENYISEIDGPRRPRPWWFILGVVLCLVIFYIWITRG